MKNGKQIVSSGQDLIPICHVNHQLLDCLYGKDPSEAQKQAVLKDIITKYNVMQGHGQDTQHQYLWDYVSTMEVSEVQHQSEYGESQDDVVQEPPIKTVCKGDLVSMELGNEITNRKRTLEDSETCSSAFKRAHRRSKFWLSKDIEGEENGGKVHDQQSVEKALVSGTGVCSDAVKKLVVEQLDGHEICSVLQVEDVTTHMKKDKMPSEDLHIVRFGKPPLCSQPPQRPPPPPPPPKQAPPPPPSLRVISMPSFHYDKQVHANTSLPCRCSTIANDCYLESYGSHVHPRLPKYEDLVANFTALKG